MEEAESVAASPTLSEVSEIVWPLVPVAARVVMVWVVPFANFTLASASAVKVWKVLLCEIVTEPALAAPETCMS